VRLIVTDDTSDPGFSWKVRKSADVEIMHHGKPASTLRGRDAAGFVMKAERASVTQTQILMARVTGNCKHGNERVATKKMKDRPASLGSRQPEVKSGWRL